MVFNTQGYRTSVYPSALGVGDLILKTSVSPLFVMKVRFMYVLHCLYPAHFHFYVNKYTYVFSYKIYACQFSFFTYYYTYIFFRFNLICITLHSILTIIRTYIFSNKNKHVIVCIKLTWVQEYLLSRYIACQSFFYTDIIIRTYIQS